MYTSWKLFLTVSAIWALGIQLGSISALEEMPDGRILQERDAPYLLQDYVLEDMPDGRILQKRDAHHLLQARQQKKKEDPKKGGSGKPQPNGGKPLSPGEEAAGQLIALLVHTGESLDAVTQMSSNSTLVKLGGEAAIKLLPEIKLARENLLKTANKQANDDGEKKLVAASDKMIKTLNEIIAKPNDSNLIKGSYQSLNQQFVDIFSVCEAAINLVVPAKAAELDAKEPKIAAEAKKDGGRPTKP